MSPSAEPGPIGYDPDEQSWGSATGSRPPFVDRLDGSLTLDQVLLREAGRDLGRQCEAQPAAVLRPGSVEDICRVMARCDELGLPVAAQGAAHTVGGQRLVEGGIAIDMTVLKDVSADDFAPDYSYIDVPAGILWADLVPLLISHEVQFAGGMTGYLGLSVGGTLSVGGVSNMPQVGAQVDYVLGLEVVVANGTRLWCSATEHPDLFDSARAGLGQAGIVTRARLQLTPAPPTVASVVIVYDALAAAFAGMRAACSQPAVDEAFVMIMPPQPGGAPLFHLHVACYGSDGIDVLGNAIDKLPASAGSSQMQVLKMRDHLCQFTRQIDQWRREGWDDRIKPWFDIFLPENTAESFVGDRLGEMTEADWSDQGFVLIFPHLRSAFRSPGLALPDPVDPGNRNEIVYLFDVLNVSPGTASAAYQADQEARNEHWMSEGRKAGGKIYPIGAMNPRTFDWRAHYGTSWPDVLAGRQRYGSPRLTPGLCMPRD
ncbi:FAD-binding protein [Amycolatopsis sp. NPDC004079]|uniref:FAD-binding protein n=1 Tax=Amycolatopsis sp. NPDC004079 TaxID=3154549 RepID=UPI0033A216FF